MAHIVPKCLCCKEVIISNSLCVHTFLTFNSSLSDFIITPLLFHFNINHAALIGFVPKFILPTLWSWVVTQTSLECAVCTLFTVCKSSVLYAWNTCMIYYDLPNGAECRRVHFLENVSGMPEVWQPDALPRSL